jgi:hypothetical protein
MKKNVFFALALGVVLCITGCSTTGTFKVPENSQLYIYERPEPVKVGADGKVTTKPFFWKAAGGISYRLEKDGKVVNQGKLRSKFRPVSIFWPPIALLYWPIGFRNDVTYDLITPQAPAVQVQAQ